MISVRVSCNGRPAATNMLIVNITLLYPFGINFYIMDLSLFLVIRIYSKYIHINAERNKSGKKEDCMPDFVIFEFYRWKKNSRLECGSIYMYFMLALLHRFSFFLRKFDILFYCQTVKNRNRLNINSILFSNFKYKKMH